MSAVKLMVMYPWPADPQQFEGDYAAHLRMLHDRMQIPADARPYSVTRFVETPMGRPPYIQVFTMPFPSAEALMATIATPAMQAIAADAARISTGGAPVILVGADAA